MRLDIEKKKEKVREQNLPQDRTAYLHAVPSSDSNRFRRLTVRDPP
jgi:hypothetical protein